MENNVIPPYQATSHLQTLGDRHFIATLVLAFLLHVGVVFGYYIVPHTKVIDIPVRALNIRLGDADVQMQDEQPPQPAVPNKAQVEDTMGRLMRAPDAEKTVQKEPSKESSKTVEKNAVEVPKIPTISNTISAPRQYVRETSPLDKNTGSALGNSTAGNAEIESRYFQTISLWLEKFKPVPADAQGLQGKAVVRISIDRHGNIRYSALEASTGFVELDRAALDMIRRANPVPAVPDEYPAGERFEFLIPVIFHIQ